MQNLKVPEPFGWLRDEYRSRALGLSLALCLILLLVLQVLDGPLKTAAVPQGVISFELAKTALVAQRILIS